MKIYDMYSLDGTLLDSGSLVELSEKYYVAESTIRLAAKTGYKLLGEYIIRDNGRTEMCRNKQKKWEGIAKWHNKGLNTVQISELLGIGESTVSRYICEMKREGILT